MVSNANQESVTEVFVRIISHKQIRNFAVHNVLKLAWTRFGPVKMFEVDEHTMKFEFDSERDKDQIMDHSPWSVQGHNLNLRMCNAEMSP